MSLPNVQTRRPFKERVKRWDIVKNRWIYLLLLPSLIFMLVFAYLPMIGIVIAFEIGRASCRERVWSRV